MLRLPSLGELDRGMAARIYLCASPTDMRKGFDTLAALVQGVPGPGPAVGASVPVRGSREGPAQDPVLGRGRICSLVQAAGGRHVSAAAACRGEDASVELKASELAMMLEGIDLKSIKRTKRFARIAAAQR